MAAPSADAPPPPPAAFGANAGRSGLILGGTAILFWSFASSLVFLGAQQAGTWRFVAIASCVGGTAQLLSWRLHRGAWSTAIRLPWRLWAVSVPCFVAYGLVWPAALVSASPAQVVGVSLINYLWPVLTVLFSAWCVPGAPLSGRMILATLLAVAGLVWANLAALRTLVAAGGTPDGTSGPGFLPYVLALAAATTWAAYSTSLARWRTSARDYATSPAGFFITGAIAAVIARQDASAAPALDAAGAWLIVGYGVGPLATGYLCWELALTRARVQTLSLLAAATPILSTLVLSLVLRTRPGPELIFAALLVGAGVLLSARR